MRDLSNAVSTHAVGERILSLLPPEAYLVGGCIRDLLLGREPLDFDIVTFGDVRSLVSEVAGHFETRPFALDPSRGVYRVAPGRGSLTIDCVQGDPGGIESDLRRRDITVNAIAWNPHSDSLVDPTRGCADLEARLVRLIGEKNLLDDPVRGLRCLRFSVQLDFDIEESTWAIVTRHAGMLANVSPERIRHEFFQSLLAQGGSRFFCLMEDAGYAPLVCGGLERHDIVAVSARTARNAEAVLRDTEAVLPGAGEHFSEELEKGLPRSSAFLLAAYLFEECRGYGPLGRVDAAARRLRLSRRAHREISGTVRGTRLIREASGTGLASGAQRYRLVDGCGTSLPEALLLTRTLGGLDTASLRGIWSYAVGPYRRQKENPLVRGDDIVRALGVEPGPPVGRLLRLVEEARADGLVKTSDEALEYLKDTVRMTPAG